MKHTTTTTTNDQQGVVSLIVTVILMVVLTITVISFATLMRREQRQTLDRQLNTQAFYAAESGINDAVAAINSWAPTDTRLATQYKSCDTGNPNNFINAAGLAPSLDTTTSYSCLLVNPAPGSLEYSNIDDTPRIVPVIAVQPAPPAPPAVIRNITVSWQAKDGDTNVNCPNAGGTFDKLVSSGDWVGATCKTGLVRVDLVPVDTVSRDALNSNLRTLFLYPTNAGAPPSVTTVASGAGSPTGVLVAGNCQSVPAATPKYCGVKIDVSAFSSGKFYLRLTSLYLASAVTLTADDGATSLGLSGAQAVIDSTGKANDVLRRVQVHVSLNPLGKGPFPGAALQSSESICKLLTVIPSASPPVDVDPSATGNPACQIN